MSVHLLLFGPPRFVQDGATAALPFSRSGQLLVHLALRRGQVPRAELAALLWPHVPADNAHTNLRKTLLRLRALPCSEAVVLHDHALGFDGSSDVADFELAIAQRHWNDALRLAHAPLLAGYDDDASEPWSVWLNAERTRLRTAWRTAAGHCLAEATDAADVLGLAAQMLADHPLDEAALRALMLAHAQQGQPALACDAYRRLAQRLADELGVAPMAELQTLYESLRTAVSAPAVGTSPAGDAVPRIIGRAAERRAAAEQLAREDCRLLTLIGPGGVGKSCLARCLVADLASGYANGAAYVALDDIDDADAFGARLARELDIALSTDGDALQTVTACLRGRHMLLVLDNFEQLTDAAPQLQSLLGACPRLQLLVTSRVRLGLAAEHLLPLDGLPCPSAEDADRLEAFDAARLFVRAAQAVDPALKPAAEAAAIADICSLVDGLPLALEMAAAWTRALPCAVIAAELRSGSELLAETPRTRPARHASMAAVFEQSWRRLNDEERSAWARLTVFHGGFTLDAARAVTGAPLRVLATLIDHSMLRKTGARADLHPLLRQLAAARLTNDDRAAAQAAHAAHYLHWLAPQQTALQTGDKPALQQVDAEFENLRAAWRWAAARGPADALQCALLPLTRYCDLRGHQQEGLALMRAAAAGIGAHDAALQPALDAAMASMVYRLGHCADAEVLARRALLVLRTTGQPELLLLCFRVLGGAARRLGRLQVARRRFRQALTQARAAANLYSAAGMRQNLAMIEHDLGRYDVARGMYMQSLVEHRRLQDALGEASCLSNLSALEVDTGQIDAAAGHLEAGLALCERHALTTLTMVVLTNLAWIAMRRNDAAAMQRFGPRAWELARQVGSTSTQSHLQLYFAQFALRQHDVAAARDAVRAAVEQAMVIDQVELQLECVLRFTELLYAQHQPMAAMRLLRYAIDHPATDHAERKLAHARLDTWSAAWPEAAALPAPAIDLWTLLQRIVAEAPAAHAPLIEALRSP